MLLKVVQLLSLVDLADHTPQSALLTRIVLTTFWILNWLLGWLPLAIFGSGLRPGRVWGSWDEAGLSREMCMRTQNTLATL